MPKCIIWITLAATSHTGFDSVPVETVSEHSLIIPYLDIWLFNDHHGRMTVCHWIRITCSVHSKHKCLIKSWVIIFVFSRLPYNAHSRCQCLIKSWLMVICIPVQTLPCVSELVSSHFLWWNWHLQLSEVMLTDAHYKFCDMLVALFAGWSLIVCFFDTNTWCDLEWLSCAPWPDVTFCPRVGIRSLHVVEWVHETHINYPC